MSDARKSHLDSGVTVDKSEYTPSTIASCLPHSSIAISISAAVFPTEVMEIQLDSIIPLLLRAIIRKMQMRSQAVLSLTSHFGEDATAAHGSQLFFVKSSRLIEMVHNWREIEVFGTQILTCFGVRKPEKEDDPQYNDQLVVIAGKDATQMSEKEKRSLWLLMDSDDVKIIIRRPRKTHPDKKNFNFLAFYNIVRFQWICHEFKVSPLRDQVGRRMARQTFKSRDISDYQTLDIEYDMPPAAEERKHYRFNSSLIGTAPIFDSFETINGIMVRQVGYVSDNEQAAKAGIRNGDIVLKINGERFLPENMEELLKFMYSQPRIRFTVLRMGCEY